jgi:biopolymer transport protein ExbB
MTRFRIALLGLILIGLGAAAAENRAISEAAANPLQDTGGAATPSDPRADPATGLLDPKSGSLFVKMFEGSAFGIAIVFLILFLSVLSVFFVIEHALSINRRKLMPSHVIADLETHIARGEVNQALELCYQTENYSLVTDVVAAGLERYQSSEFGFAEYRTAVEEAGEDFTGRLYRKTEVLNVIGSIAPMLGLLGTVVGMIEAFNTIAAREGMARPEELAGGIGQALITTLLGLFVAIPTMVAFSFFRNKIDSLVAEAGKRIERMMLPLGRKR